MKKQLCLRLVKSLFCKRVKGTWLVFFEVKNTNHVPLYESDFSRIFSRKCEHVPLVKRKHVPLAKRKHVPLLAEDFAYLFSQFVGVGYTQCHLRRSLTLL